MRFLLLAGLNVLSSLLAAAQPESLTTGSVYPAHHQDNTTHLYFGLMMSFGGSFKSSGVIPGVQMALDLVNNRTSDILSGYTLHYILRDSQVRLNSRD